MLTTIVSESMEEMQRKVCLLATVTVNIFLLD